jgi:predicted nucleic acid-binding protein
VIAAISGAEVVAAVARRGQGGSLSTATASRLIADFRQDFASEFQVVEVLSPIIDSAMRLAERYALRGYDSVQLAAALGFNAIARATGGAIGFVSADLELNTAATAEGLAVENPDDHL